MVLPCEAPASFLFIWSRSLLWHFPVCSFSPHHLPSPPAGLRSDCCAGVSSHRSVTRDRTGPFSLPGSPWPFALDAPVSTWGFLRGLCCLWRSAASGRAVCQRIERFAVPPRRSVLLAFLGPAVLHPLASRVGLVPDWSTLRAATAFVAATTASMLVVPSLAQIFAPSGVHPLHRQPVSGPAATCRPPGGGGA